jgi:hypothetical protein
MDPMRCHIGSRKVHISGFTLNPNQQWMQQIAHNVTMADVGFKPGKGSVGDLDHGISR